MSGHAETERKINARIAELLLRMPDYVKKYVRSIRNSTSPRTQYEYLLDIAALLDYISGPAPYPALDALDGLDKEFFEEYMETLLAYEKDGRVRTNGRASLQRKLVSLRRFFGYLYKNNMIRDNPISKVEMPKVGKKAIIRLENGEPARLLDAVARTDGLTDKQEDYARKQSCRDAAIISLLLATGMRVSELAELDVSDIDMDKCQARIVRKGGNESVVYFSDTARDALAAWLDDRALTLADNADKEPALFLSSRKTRMSVRAIQQMVRKHAARAVPLKRITPHKLRATFATELYKATGDIYLVADALGHSDVNTTKEHYADLSTDRKESIRNLVNYKK